MKSKREFIIAFASLFIGVIATYLFLKSITAKPVIVKELPSETAKVGLSNKSNLKTSYFDDFRGVWGDGMPNGGISWSAGDSRYAEQSMPTSIIHPLTGFKTDQVKIIPASIKRPEKNNIYVMDVSVINKIIDENIAKDGNLLGGFFSNKGEMITSHAKFDVDSDGINEDIIETANFGGNHPPHNGYIIKNDVIIWYTELDAGSIDQAKDGNGFYVKNPIRDDGSSWCCSNGYRRYRLIYDKKSFIPVWEQDVHYLRFDK